MTEDRIDAADIRLRRIAAEGEARARVNSRRRAHVREADFTVRVAPPHAKRAAEIGIFAAGPAVVVILLVRITIVIKAIHARGLDAGAAARCSAWSALAAATTAGERRAARLCCDDIIAAVSLELAALHSVAAAVVTIISIAFVLAGLRAIEGSSTTVTRFAVARERISVPDGLSAGDSILSRSTDTAALRGVATQHDIITDETLSTWRGRIRYPLPPHRLDLRVPMISRTSSGTIVAADTSLILQLDESKGVYVNISPGLTKSIIAEVAPAGVIPIYAQTTRNIPSGSWRCPARIVWRTGTVRNALRARHSINIPACDATGRLVVTAAATFAAAIVELEIRWTSRGRGR